MPQKIRFADYLASGAVEMVSIPRDGFNRIAQLYARYADQEPDLADMALIWLGETTGYHRIRTLANLQDLAPKQMRWLPTPSHSPS